MASVCESFSTQKVWTRGPLTFVLNVTTGRCSVCGIDPLFLSKKVIFMLFLVAHGSANVRLLMFIQSGSIRLLEEFLKSQTKAPIRYSK